ncbi:MAG: methyl-accepting chemotaxis protein [Myxococcota bacterium]
MRFGLRSQLIFLVIATVVVTAFIALRLADLFLGATIEESLLRRSDIVAEAISASNDVASVVKQAASRLESPVDTRAQRLARANALSFLAELVNADEELDYVYLGTLDDAGRHVSVAWEPLDARVNGFDLSVDDQRQEFVEVALAGELRRGKKRIHRVVELFDRPNSPGPPATVVMGLDVSIQLTRYRSAMRNSYIASAAILLVLLFLFFIRLERRFAELLSYSSRLATGELNAPAPRLGGNELGEISEALSTIGRGLGDSMDQIRLASDELEDLSSSVKDASSRIADDAGSQALSLRSTSSAVSSLAASSAGVDALVRKLSGLAESSQNDLVDVAREVESIGEVVEDLRVAVEQAKSHFNESERGMLKAEAAVRMLTTTAEDTAAAMNQITASIAFVDDGTDQALERSRESASTAEAGVVVAQQTVEAIRGIRDNTAATMRSVRFLSEQVQSIDQILRVINDIANQTKLLSLNASIIAAQAGEHGSGFLVVADEIKALAAKTAGSTREISHVINEVQRVASDAIGVAERSMGTVDDEVARVEQADHVLHSIRESSIALGTQVRRIAEAMNEQSKSAEQVNAAMQDVHGTASSVGAIVNRQLDSGRQLERSMKRVVKLLEETMQTTRQKSARVRQATQALGEMFEQLVRVRDANEEQAHDRNAVLNSVDTLRGLSERNRESAEILASAVDKATEKVERLAAAVDRFD